MKTRIITAIVGILVLIGVLFTFDTLVFNFVIAAITLIAIHEVFKALGFGRKEWPMYAVFVPYTLLIMLSSYQVWRRLVPPSTRLASSLTRESFSCRCSWPRPRPHAWASTPSSA